MELKQKKRSERLIVALTSLWIILILIIGIWWLYLILSMGKELDLLYQLRPELNQGLDLAKLAMWEGLSFLFLLLMVSGTLIFYYFKDQRKSKSLQAFFASVTHELKTPLASMQLQAEVLRNGLGKDEPEKVEVLTNRLVQDVRRMENELDKILQLSRIEMGGNLNLTPININSFIKNIVKERSNEISVLIKGDEGEVLADEFALTIMIRNLIDNSIKHAKVDEDKKVEAQFIIRQKAERIHCLYYDNGLPFEGDPTKISQLFYKFNSSKGSGIGLYLIKQLMIAMKGEFKIEHSPGLVFNFCFKTSTEQ